MGAARFSSVHHKRARGAGPTTIGVPLRACGAEERNPRMVNSTGPYSPLISSGIRAATAEPRGRRTLARISVVRSCRGLSPKASRRPLRSLRLRLRSRRRPPPPSESHGAVGRADDDLAGLRPGEGILQHDVNHVHRDAARGHPVARRGLLIEHHVADPGSAIWVLGAKSVVIAVPFTTRFTNADPSASLAAPVPST